MKIEEKSIKTKKKYFNLKNFDDIAINRVPLGKSLMKGKQTEIAIVSGMIA